MSISASLISNIKEQLIIIEHTQLIKSFPSSGRTQYPIISRQTNDIFLLLTVLSSPHCLPSTSRVMMVDMWGVVET